MEKKNPLLVKKHWHLLVFHIPDVGLPKVNSVYASSKNRLISVPEIAQSRATARIPEHAIISGHSYLGYGSQSQLTGEDPKPKPSEISPIYLQAMEAVTRAPDPQVLVNPFTVEEHGEYAVQEWASGYAAALHLKNLS